MTTSTITINGLLTVTKGPRDKSWTASVAVDWTQVPEKLWPELLAHGMKQKIADAASGAKDATEAYAAMFKALDAVYAGDWSSRGAGEGLSDVRSVAVYRLYVATMDSDTRKRFNKAFDSQAAKVRKALENVAAFTAEVIDAEVAKIEAERAAKVAEETARKEAVAALAGKVKFDF